MPNWCSNNASFSHEDQSKVEALAAAFNEGKPFMTFMPPPSKDWEHGWCSENWGTKWDVEPGDTVEVEDGSFNVWFDSAWSPPIGFYNHLVEQGWSIDATYHEPGMTFAGHYEDGSDYCVEYDFTDPNWRDGIEDSEVLDMLEQEYESWLEWQDDSND